MTVLAASVRHNTETPFAQARLSASSMGCHLGEAVKARATIPAEYTPPLIHAQPCLCSAKIVYLLMFYPASFVRWDWGGVPD